MDHSADLADNRPSRRLSRPRSLVSSSHLLKRLEQHHKTLLSLAPSISYEGADFPTFARSKSRERSNPQDARSKLRAYLQGSRNVKADSSDDDDEEGQRGLPGIAKSVKHRLSRAGTTSSTTQLSSAGASTSQLSTYSSTQLDLTDSARMVEEIKEKAYMDSIAALNHVPSPIDGDMHVDSIPSPIRRKSLFTPGIATRTPNDILRKPPPPQILQSQADRDYYFNPYLSTSSPLARLAALDTGRSGRTTPTLDYSHLGGLKLGTLRVTNGPTSPNPQEVVSHSSDDTSAPYIVDGNQAAETTTIGKSHEKATATFDCSTESNEEAFSSSPSSSLSSSYSPIEHEPKPRDGGESKIGDTASTVQLCRTESPLEYERVMDDKVLKQNPSRNAHTKWLNRKQSLPSGFFAGSSNAASTMTFDYRQALPETPFQRPQTVTGDKSKSVGGSKIDGTDDASFDDEGLVMRKSYRSALEMWRSFVHDAGPRKPNNGTREDAYRKLNANSAGQQNSVSRPTSSSASAKTMDLHSIYTDPSTIQSSQNADSGYNSSESLALSRKTPLDDIAIASLMPEASESSPRKSSRLSGPRRLSWSSSRKARTGDVAPSVDKQPLSFPSAAAAGVAQLAPQAAHSAEPINTVSKAKTASQTFMIPSPRGMFKIYKLGRADRPSQHLPVNTIVVQGVHQLSQSNIPEVPRAIALKHAERLHKFPSLNHTFPSMKHVSSYESLLGEKHGSVPIRFPSPAQSLERADSDSICRTDLDWPSSRSTRTKKLKSASKARRRSSQAEGVVSITDFGTVAECLRGSPYDVATPTTPSAPKKASNSHPHQISTALPRARSMITMTNESYMQFAKSPSRMSTHSLPGLSMSSSKSFDGLDKTTGNLVQQRYTIIDRPPVPALPAKYSAQEINRDVPRPLHSFGQESPNHEKPSTKSPKPPNLVTGPRAILTIPAKDEAKSKSPNAPQSPEVRRKSFNDRGGIPGKLARPRSMYEKVPPVPVLPSKSQLEQIEAQVSKFNPGKPNMVAASVKIQKFAEKTTNADDESNGESSDLSDNWKPLREAWSQRRKSAGDALLLQSQLERSSLVPIALDGSAHSLEFSKDTSVAQKFAQELSNNPIQTATAISYQRRPPLRHISKSQSALPAVNGLTASSQVSRPADKPSTPKPAQINTLAGRFAGGFHYEYEPGFGLGGSAGTRTVNSTASRKSVGVSQGFGLDLSDVPIFLAPR